LPQRILVVIRQHGVIPSDTPRFRGSVDANAGARII
jgi:hypothetical protein